MAERAEAVGRENQESILLDYVERLGRFREGRQAVHVHLSRLRPHNRRGHHMRIAGAAFDRLVKSFEGGLFRMANGDLVFLARGAGVSDIDEAILRLWFLFSDDPLVSEEVDGEDRFCTWYDLERDYPRLLVLARRLAQGRREAAPAPAVVGAPKSRPLELRHLAEVERVAAAADLANLLRRQPVCFIEPGPAPRALFHEIYVSIADLRDAVLPGVDLASDRWLFQHLTQTLDQRVLALLMRDGIGVAGGFSLNLNLATVLAPEFMQFDAAMRGRADGSITVELQQLDMFADLSSYRFARDFLKDRGYRLCLDGADPLILSMFDHARLGLDLVKLRWQKGMSEDLAGERLDELKDIVAAIGRDRVILCRCDGETAEHFGQSLGIAMFQGRHVDALLQGVRRRALA